jgi:hypothetical protein
MDALRQGVVAQNLSFLSVADNYFRQKKMRLPRGAAGADAYVGPPMYANKPNPFSQTGKRTLPLRSKIRDNVDEYIGGGGGAKGWGSSDNSDKVLQSMMNQQNKNKYELEKKALNDLDGVNAYPVDHPAGDTSGVGDGDSAWLKDHDNQVLPDDPALPDEPDLSAYDESF